MGFLSTIKRGLCIVGRFFKKNEPKIMIGSGVVCLVFAIADGVYAGTKVEKVVNDNSNEIKAAEKTGDQEKINEVKLKMIFDVAKLFWHVAASAGVGIVLVSKGTAKYEKRIVTLIGAYNLLWDKFGNYRGEVINEFGADADRRFITKSEKLLESGSGDRKIVSPDNEVKDDEWKLGKYVRYAGPYECEWWDPVWDINREYFLAWLDGIEAELNRIFRIEQVILANDANKKITIARDQTGGTCGWDSSKVDYISLGHRDPKNPTIGPFLRGDRDDIMLNMNCSGFCLTALEMKDKAWRDERNRYAMEGR